MADFRLSFPQLEKGRAFAIGETHRITVLSVSRVRLIGMFFDLNKCFLLPSAMKGVRGIKREYNRHPDSNLLVVGHTDTSGRDDFNLALSLERADAMAAYLTDKVEAWEAFFEEGKPAEKRWGALEIQLMLSAVPEGPSPFFQGKPSGVNDGATAAAVKKFQEAQRLKADGIAGPITRRELIRKYMAIDGTTLPAGIAITTHGCGENFPVAETQDGVRSPEDRRVEIYFFDGPIAPPPPGKTSARGSSEFPQWVAQAGETTDFSAEDADLAEVFIGLQPPFATPLPKDAAITFAPDSGDPETILLRDAIDRGDGLLHFRVVDPQPGVLYTATVRLSQDGAPATLFSDLELHRLVADKGGGGFTPPPPGQDGLVFQSETEPEPDEVTSDPHTAPTAHSAEFDARAGKVAPV